MRVSTHAERAHACPPAPSRRDLGVKRRAGRGSHRCCSERGAGFQWFEKVREKKKGRVRERERKKTEGGVSSRRSECGDGVGRSLTSATGVFPR